MEGRFWVFTATWRRPQCVWQRSVFTLCPASPLTMRTVAARLDARPNPQVSTIISCQSFLGLLLLSPQWSPHPPTHPIPPSPFPPPHGFYFPSLDKVNSINSGPALCHGHVIFSIRSCSVDSWLEQMSGLLPYSTLFLGVGNIGPGLCWSHHVLDVIRETTQT